MKCMGISLETEFARGSSTEHPQEDVPDEKAMILMTESLMMTGFHFEQSYL